MSLFVAVRDAIDVIDDALLVALHQAGESVAIALEDTRHQGAVVELLCLRHLAVRLPPREGFRPGRMITCQESLIRLFAGRLFADRELRLAAEVGGDSGIPRQRPATSDQ